MFFERLKRTSAVEKYVISKITCFSLWMVIEFRVEKNTFASHWRAKILIHYSPEHARHK